MNNKQINKSIAQLIKTVKRIRVEEDNLLPDYSSDIVRVVRCEGLVSLDSKKINARDGNITLDISGKVDFSVVYVGEGGGVESGFVSVPFFDSLRLPLPNFSFDPESITAIVRPYKESCSCKVQSPRRMSVRGDVALDIEVIANTLVESYVERGEGDYLCESITEEYLSACVVSSHDEEFKISTELKLPKNCPPMERILLTDAKLLPESTSCSDGKMNFWGNCGVLCMYVPETEGEELPTLESFYQPIEVKGTVELPDVTSDTAVLINMSPMSMEYEILADNLGENRILKLDLTYLVQSIFLENTPVSLTHDIYGVGVMAIPEFDTFNFKKYLGSHREINALKERIPLKKEITAVEGAKGEIIVKNAGFDNGAFIADCHMNFSAVGISEDGESQVSDSIDFVLSLNFPSEFFASSSGITFDIEAGVGFVECSVMDGVAEISFDVTTVASVYSTSSVRYVSNLEFSENFETRDSVVFYYPSTEDTLWTVGKRYGVSQKKLLDDNGGELRRVMVID
ncbi:MAG: hypothetical protein E7582_03165 [Ruminococcaceae bacterium]|nr:hypothetical protein [Oscillospiraceae bacterium]